MQSAICIALSALLLVGSRSHSAKFRAALTTAVLAAFLALAFILPLPEKGFVMGDGSSIVQDRNNFDEVVRNNDDVRFSAHLAYRLLDHLDVMLGSTQGSSLGAYRWLSWLAGAMSALLLWCLAAAEGWSARSVRYVALTLIAPATLMYFGYLEVAYLSLSAAAFPFVARDLVKGSELTIGLLVGAILFGIGAALHGVGYLAILALFLAVLASDLPVGRRVVLATALSAIAIGAALIWLWYYLVVLGYDVVPGHANGGFMSRPLWTTAELDSRILYPMFSLVGIRDIVLSGLVAGLPLTLVALGAGRQWPRELKMALAFTAPCLVVFVLFWPVQGIAIEMDMIVAAFPAVFALLWVCSQSVRASVVSAVLLAAGHATFWWVVFDDRFVNGMIR
ncbi:MAG: hypothetical protein ABL986_04285 [Vicinamibacterales bacterium]